MSTVAIPEVKSTPTSNSTITTWNIDPVHSTAQFKVKHMMISNVKGEFTSVKGSLQFDEQNIAGSHVEAEIDASSINTRDPQRDTHLKSHDFLDVEKFPTLSFRSTHISQKADGELAATGDLTIHGVKRPVTFAVEDLSAPTKDPWGNTRIGLSATTRINRKDFGLSWNAVLETGGIMVGDEVTITLDIEFTKAD
jgi:polyisoprenoid-binding protein YceI